GSYGAAVGGKRELSPGVPREAYLGYALGALILALLFAAWCAFVRWSARASSGAERSESGSAVAAASTHGNMGQRARDDAGSSRTLRSAWGASSLLIALGALVVTALGILFPSVRPVVHEPRYVTLILIWLALWAAALVTSWRTRRIELAALVLGWPLFFAVPTVYRYGAPAAMAPAWLGLSACVAALLPRRLPPLAAAVLGALLVPFGLAEATGFRFDDWVLWPPAVLPSGFLLLSLVAKWVVLVPRGHVVLGLAAAALVTAAQLGAVPYPLQLVAACAWLAFWALAARRQRSDESNIACVTALLLLHHYAVRLPTQAYYWQDCLLAALVLSARLIRPLPSPARSYAHGGLLLLAFFVSGWVSFAWTLHRLEWAFLSDFWSAGFVERHVASFLPLLMGRFALPLIAARVLLRRELPEPEHRMRALAIAWLLVGSKVASLMFWSYGTAFVSVASDVYLEAVQETSLACVLLLGLL
ncbi:MAG TPA: hypothetical protein VMF89_19835, partial [Polyangiales bacterium]|nr:hypothetical protein [Polyangiales bacterium]